jgi:branched-chain amino acid transport system permease protein
MTDFRARFWLNLLVALAGIVLFALVPSVFNRGVVFLAGLVAINVVFALSWNLLFAGVGLLSFGQAMFYAGGAYMMAVLSLHVPGMPFLLALLVGALTGGAIAFVFGVVALRRASGTYFAILTLAFAELVHIVITKTNFLGRNDGLVGIRRPVVDLGFTEINLGSGNTYYYFLIVAMAVAAFALWCLQNSPAGRLMQAIRQDPVRAAFLGADVQSWKLIAFIVSGCFAGFSGAVLFGVMDYGTRNLQGLADLTVGLLLLAVVLAIPGGITGLLSRAFARRRIGAKQTAKLANGEKAS